MDSVRRLSEGLARKTTRRGLFGRGADIAFGALIGAATGTLTRRGRAGAAGEDCNPMAPFSTPRCTACAPPGPMCYCEHCTEAAVCAKPCVINTTWYASGCWVTGTGGSITCCDCTCPPGPDNFSVCGCATDFHSDPQNCPKWTGQR